MMENGVGVCSPEQEHAIIGELIAKELPMNEGDVYYILSKRWFDHWQRYVTNEFDYSFTTSRPRYIDNRHLLLQKEDDMTDDDNHLDLLRSLQEDIHYVLVSHPVWNQLHDWYKGGPALPRKVISQGYPNKIFLVEVFPLCLKLIDARDYKQHLIRISKKAFLADLYHQAKMILGIEEEKVCIWDFFNKAKQSALDVADQSLEEANLLMDQEILLEVSNSPVRWLSEFQTDSTGNGLALVPVEPSRSSITIAGGPTLSNGYSTRYTSSYYEGNSLVSSLTDVSDGYNLRNMTEGERGGLAGLQNLGNTCFMNSAIQCLVHTPRLVEYFLQDYSNEINKENPIGMQGELAIAFGELLRKLWSSGRAPVAPRVFKAKLGRFAPQFSGYNQHDSHELLAFLLDGLHEDLNRVKSKPYIEMKDADGRPDEEVADECWHIHKARNDSVIVDVCQGQYKSTLVCPVCSKVSVTFDPFMYLSLPLPSRVTRSMTINVLYGDGSALPMPYTVTVLKNGCYNDLLQAISTACCLKSDESLLLAEVYEHTIFRYLENLSEPLSLIKDDEHIVAYRLPKKQDGFIKLEIIHQRVEKGDRKILGAPLVTCLAKGPQTITAIENAVLMVLKPLLRSNSLHWLDTDVEDGSTSGTKDNEPAPATSGTNDDGPATSGTNDDGSAGTGDRACELGDKSVDTMELDQMSNKTNDFNLYLANDRKGLHCSPIKEDFLFQPDQLMRVVVDWSDRDFDMFDITYLEDLPVVHKTGFTAKKTRQESISLFSCLEAFLKEEPLGPDDMWYCPTCKEHRQATKKLDLWRLPEILVVHLKRFSYSRYMKNKLESFVSFPVDNLDLGNYVKSKTGAPQFHSYELYAISNHYGGLGGGHYSAYAKLIEENRWYHFDDSYVSPMSEDEIKTSAAYVLFYKRVQETGMGESSPHNSSCG